MSIDVKQAVKSAREQATLFFEEEDIKNLMLEEVEYDDNSDIWLITLGYDSPNTVKRRSGPNIYQTIQEEVKRVYKIFNLNGETGKFISMKIRDV